MASLFVQHQLPTSLLVDPCLRVAMILLIPVYPLVAEVGLCGCLVEVPGGLQGQSNFNDGLPVFAGLVPHLVCEIRSDRGWRRRDGAPLPPPILVLDNLPLVLIGVDLLRDWGNTFDGHHLVPHGLPSGPGLLILAGNIPLLVSDPFFSDPVLS